VSTWCRLAPAAVEAIGGDPGFTGRGRWCFQHPERARTSSENAIGYLLNRAGYRAGTYRAVGGRFSSVMNERFPADRQVITLCWPMPRRTASRLLYRAVRMDRRGSSRLFGRICSWMGVALRADECARR